jgi:hypothetical protein
MSRIEKLKNKAQLLGYKWMSVDASGEVWAGENKPEYHELYHIWIWPFDKKPCKIGYVYPVNNWKESIWQLTP